VTTHQGTATSVVLAPGVPDAIADTLPDALRLPEVGDDDTWVARTALALTQSSHRLAPPLVLVFAGENARHAPGLGFAQRAARRGVRGYVFIDPQLPAAGQVSDWPDAPVTVLLAAEEDVRARDARLRGWEVVIGPAEEIISDLVARP
jgi:hypothetical protein